MKIVNSTAAIILLICAALAAQSVIPQAVKETVNLAPRAKKGDLQKYLLTYEIARLKNDGSINSLTTDYLAFSQVCMANSPEAGIRYQITIDSFAIGTSRRLDEKERECQIAPQFDGYTFPWSFDRTIRTKNGDLDLGVSITEPQVTVEGLEFLLHFTYLRLWEQARFSLARQLTKIGDSAILTIPAPFRRSLENVIREFKIGFSPQTYELGSVSTYKGRPCAVVKLLPSTSPIRANLAVTKTAADLIGDGTLSLVGELWISLDSGQIVRARWQGRTVSTLTTADGKAVPSHSIETYNLDQLN